MTEVNIAFTVDNDNLDQVAVVVASILAHSSEPAALCFFVIFDGLVDVAEQKIRGWSVKPPNLTLVPFENAFAGRTRLGHISTTALLRTQLPNALPDLDRVLYLDADIVVRRDIAELYRSDLDGNPVGGIVDLGMYMWLRRDTIHGDFKMNDYLVRLGLDPRQSQYVNSGVLLMDLAALRNLNFSAEAISFSNERGAELITMDQCLINSVLLGRIATLDPRWNACGHMMSRSRHHHYIPRRLQPNVRLQKDDPWLIHYTGKYKPWNAAEVWRGSDWWAHAERSGIAWPPPVPSAARRPSRLMAAWRSVTWGVSYALNRLHPD